MFRPPPAPHHTSAGPPYSLFLKAVPLVSLPLHLSRWDLITPQLHASHLAMSSLNSGPGQAPPAAHPSRHPVPSPAHLSIPPPPDLSTCPSICPCTPHHTHHLLTSNWPFNTHANTALCSCFTQYLEEPCGGSTSSTSVLQTMKLRQRGQMTCPRSHSWLYLSSVHLSGQPATQTPIPHSP